MTKPMQASVLRVVAIVATIAALLSGSLTGVAVANTLEAAAQPRQRAEPLTLKNFEVRVAAQTECANRTVRATITVEIVGKTLDTKTISARLSGATASAITYTPPDRYIGQMLPPGVYNVEAVFSDVTVTSGDGTFTVIARAEFDAQRARKEATTAPLSFPPECSPSPTATPTTGSTATATATTTATPTTGSTATATATPTTGETATATATATPTTGETTTATATTTPTTGETTTATATPTTGSPVTATPTTGSANPTASVSVALSYDCLSATRSAVATVTITVVNGAVRVDQFVGALEGSTGGTISYSPADIVGQTLQPGTTTVSIQFSDFTPTATLLRAAVNATIDGVLLSASDIFSTDSCITRPTLTPTASAERPTLTPTTSAERPTLSDVTLAAELGYDCANPTNVAAAVIRIGVSGEPITVEQLTIALQGASGGTISYNPADKFVGQTLQPGSHELRVDFQGFSMSGDSLSLSVDGSFSGKQRSAGATFARSEQCVAAPPATATPPALPTAESGAVAPPPATALPTAESGSVAASTPTAAAPAQRQDVAGASGSDESATSDQADEARSALLPNTGVVNIPLLVMLTVALLLIALGSGLRAARLLRE